MSRFGRLLVLLALPLLLSACGEEPAPTVPATDFEVLSWAKVAPEQVAEARKHGVPVAFENEWGMRFVLVPAGRFLMGSPDGEDGRDDDERQHPVRLMRVYYMQTTEVTNGQYRALRRSHDSGKNGRHSLNGDAQPVVNVSWEEATSYAGELSRRDRARTYRIPTEAEWEYACRAGTTTRYSFGDREEELPRYANFFDRNDPSGPARSSIEDGRGVTAAVGSYLPNPWGLYDMHGNVWEWCRDWYASEYPRGEVTDPTGPFRPQQGRVLRGGSWYVLPARLRSAERYWVTPDPRVDIVGFRLVVPLPPSSSLPDPKQDATE